MATDSSSQREQVAEQGTPVCDACQEYDCKLKLPGQFAGTYLTFGGEEEKNGPLCILHFRDPNKDAQACARAVEEKIRNKDLNFRHVQFSCPVTFHGEIENAEFWGATFSRWADFERADFKESVRFKALAKSRDEKGNPTDRRIRLDCRHVTLEKPDKVHFSDVDMAEVSFVGTDVRKVEFINVQWPEGLRDERKAGQAEEWFSLGKLRSWLARVARGAAAGNERKKR